MITISNSLFYVMCFLSGWAIGDITVNLIVAIVDKFRR